MPPSQSLRALALSLALASFGCSKPEPPRVTAQSAQLASVGPTGFTIAVNLDVYNPNGFPLLVRSVTGTLRLTNGATLAQGRAEPQSSIPSEASTIVPATLTMAWSDVKQLAPFALTGAPVPYTFEGTATVGGEKLNVDVPFQLKGELTPAQLLEIGLRGLMR